MELKYHIVTFGCQKNEYDTQVIAALVTSAGYTYTKEIADADLIIMNTCCVRNKADVKVYGRLGQYAPLKKANPDLVIVVAGCLAQKDGKRLLSRFPHLNLVVGTRNLNLLPELIDEARKGGRRRYLCDMKEMEFDNLPVLRGDEPFAWIPITEGCDCRCTYCIVPYVRGSMTSRRPDKILEEIRRFVDNGGVEVTLLGQNVNAYGKDSPDYGNFESLLESVNAIEGLKRIRFTSPHPANFEESLINKLPFLDKVCEHIHLPLQAGDDKVLRRMGRSYTTEMYRGVVDMLRRAIPDISITTDIISGFPGESEEQFENTLNFIREIRFDGAFMFAYSEREGTPAVKMDGIIPPSVRNQRLNRLIALQNAITMEKHKALEGSFDELLVETISKKDEHFLTGKTRRRTVVNFKGGPELVGKFVNVRLKKGYTWGLIGETVDPISP